jgi:NADH:ubiquinone reductase (H+-translocating)
MKQKFLEKKNIIILGGGFAGIRTALDLSDWLSHNDEYEIILIDKKDYQTYYSALYEAATTEHGLVEAKKVKKSVVIPFADILARKKAKFFKAYIDSIDLENGKIVTDSRILSFDYLVIAMGSVADYYGIPNLDKFGYSLKSLEDAIMIRNRVEDIVSKKDSAQIVIGGGGFAGVEFAGEVYNLIKHECVHHGKEQKNFKIMIVEGATTYLSGLSNKVSELVAERFKSMEIETRFSTLISDAGKDFVELNKKEKVNCDLLIWTGGVKSCRLPLVADLERDKKDRTPTTDFLNLKKFPNVFVAGDNVCYIDPKTKKPVPATAQEAIKQGAHVAKSIYRMITGKPLTAYHPGPMRFIIPVAGKYAILYTPNVIIPGFLGWVIRRGADLRYFLSILPIFKAIKYWLFETFIFVKND